MEFLDVDDVIAIHDDVLARSGGHPGILNIGLLEACLDRCRWGPLDGEIDLACRAAFLIRGIGQDHPFADGNKRTAFESADTFAERNGHKLVATPDAIVDFMLDVAQARLRFPAIQAWLQGHLRKD